MDLKLDEVLPGIEFDDPNASSLKRFIRLVNDRGFRGEHGITNLYFDLHQKHFPMGKKIGPLYWVGGKLVVEKEEGRLVSEDPLAYAFSDGGLEYLEDFSGISLTGKPKYQCKLWVPERGVLTYSHPVKNEDLKALLRRG